MEETPKEDSQEKNWIIFAAIVIIAIAAICILIAGSLYYLNWRGENLPFTAELQTLMAENPTTEDSLPATPEVEYSAPPPFALPTLPQFEIPTRQPTEPVLLTPEPTATLPNLTGNQYLDDFTMIDDFSSNAFEWPEIDNGIAIIQIENEAYSFHLLGAGTAEQVIAPVPYDPSYILFDVTATSANQDGAFGVICQVQDVGNYYFIEFNLQEQEVRFGKIANNQFTPLTEPDNNFEYWVPVNPLSPDPGAVNTIAVDCRLGVINLLVNDEFIQTVPVNTSFNAPGEIGFFVRTFDSAEPGGYQVYFDNVLIR